MPSLVPSNRDAETRTARVVTLAARPKGFPQRSDFSIVERPLAQETHGDVVVETLWLSLDPYQRGRMNDAESYDEPLRIGDPMPGGIVGRVVESRAEGFVPGDLVEGLLTWSDLHRVPSSLLRKLDAETADPVTHELGLRGIPGLSAWFGLTEIGRPRPGDTVVVSAAAGGVGQIVGQIARLAGCRTVGIVGSPAKAAYITEELGYDAAIDYRREDVAARVKALCPDGVDVYFDNVGGAVSDAVFRSLVSRARVIVCGRMSQNNRETPDIGPRDYGFLTTREVHMEGFLLRRFAPGFGPARERLAALHRSGAMSYREDVATGLDRAPEAFIGLLRGDYLGKVLVDVAADRESR